jgi:hypothetical protein
MAIELKETNKKIKKLEDRGPPTADHQPQPAKDQAESIISTEPASGQTANLASTHPTGAKGETK